MFSQLTKLTSIPETLLIGTAVIILLIIIGLLVWWIYKASHPSEEQQLEKVLRQNSLAVEKGVILSDGLYGYHFVDFLVLFPRKILVLGVQHGDGYIFGGEHMEQWAQVLNQKSYKFDNPLIRINHSVHTINEIVDANIVDVIGRVVFTGKNSFPKGVPEGVFDRTDLERNLQKLHLESTTDGGHINRVWDDLLKISRDHRQLYRVTANADSQVG